MPVEFLSQERRERLGRFSDDPTADRSWTMSERRGVLFDLAVAWLLEGASATRSRRP